MKQTITAYGHENVVGNHPTTIEITKDCELSITGDCIIGIGASGACADILPEIRDLIQSSKKVHVILSIGAIQDVVTGWGDPGLTLTHERDIVIRKSNFKCSRTLMINADKAACDLNPELLKRMENPHTKLNFTIEVAEEAASGKKKISDGTRHL